MTGTRKVSIQMDSLCEQYNWLSDVWEFTSSWKGSQREYNMSADDFEVRNNLQYFTVFSLTLSFCYR